jgi:putative transcriptional regulator
MALALGAIGGEPDRDPRKLKAGLFLYASPAMQDPNFAESVVLLVEHGSSGSMGLIVNRPTRVPLRELLPGFDASVTKELRFYSGGPVQPEAILALVRTNWPSESARRVVADVYLTGALDDVRTALGGKDPGSTLRVFTGYAGWGKGQLDAEVRAGAWVMDRADARSVFTPDPSDLWQRVFSILDRLVA